ncbi:hypothetical protein [Rubrobacter indicoceani]|uniref:hypothetical protein n=1 Tax=Rubrobacter indicoceani TaxID=2051957 RepID=UPI000E5B5F21|nr:hypothetical protein [Rubrobacter indicoceani]
MTAARETADHKNASQGVRFAPAEGLDFIGEYRDSGLADPPYLVRRADGQVVQLSRLLYLLVGCMDGFRDAEEISERVSLEFGRRVTAQNVEFLVEKKLLSLGLLAAGGGSDLAPPRLDAAFLGLRYRIGLLSAGTVWKATTPFLWLFRRGVMVGMLVALLALDVWALAFHGVLEGVQEILYQPSLILAFVAIEMFAMAWHECGHAAACRYGGAKPGVVGVGIYVIWFVFYSDVTDSYRLDKRGRLRTDAGGLYFDAIFTLGIAAAYFLTGFEPLLILALLNQLNALDEFSPFLRLDGYYIMSDLTGIPDPFKYVKPVLLGLIPGRTPAPEVRAMKPWVRRIITLWVLSVVPVLFVGLGVLIFYGPWFLSKAWDSLRVQLAGLSEATREGTAPEVLLGLLNVAALLIPVLGGTLLLLAVFGGILRRVRRRLNRSGCSTG